MEELMEDVSCRMEAIENTVLTAIREVKTEITQEFEKIRQEMKNMEEKVYLTISEKADTSVNSMLEEIASDGAEIFESIECNEDLQEYRPKRRHSLELLSLEQIALVNKLTTENPKDNIEILALKIVSDGRRRGLWPKDFNPPGSKQPTFVQFLKEKIKNIRRKAKIAKYSAEYTKTLTSSQVEDSP